MLLQSIVNGLLLGGLYAVVGVGMSLIFGVMRIVNLAHGDFLMVGMYTAFWLFTFRQVDPYLAVPVAFAVLFLVGILVHWGFVGPLLRKNAPEENAILLTLAVGLAITELVRMAFTAEYRAISTPLATATVSIGGISISLALLLASAIALLISGLIYALLMYTETGRSLRATAQDKQIAQMLGVDGERIYRLAFALGAGTAGAAGALLLPIYYASPTVGSLFTLKAFIVTVLGGMGSVLGALVGGLTLGVAETLGAVYVSTAYKDIIGYLVFIVVLSLFPSGLVGRSRV